MPRVSVARGTAIDSFDTKRKEAKMMNFGYGGGLVGVLILVGDIWAIINILQSSVSNEKKLIWTIAVVLLPLLGLILWFFLGPRGGKA
jgi:Phospholipase_D-nuclease N-terminal